LSPSITLLGQEESLPQPIGTNVSKH